MNLINFLTEVLKTKEEWEILSFNKHQELLKNPSELVDFLDSAEEEFLNIKNKYCTDNVKFGGVSFSNNPKLSISKVEISIVTEKKTSAILKVFPKNSLTYYLFTLKLIGEEWKINNIQMVGLDDGEKSKWSF